MCVHLVEGNGCCGKLFLQMSHWVTHSSMVQENVLTVTTFKHEILFCVLCVCLCVCVCMCRCVYVCVGVCVCAHLWKKNVFPTPAEPTWFHSPSAAFILPFFKCTWHLVDNNCQLKLKVSSTGDNCSSVCSNASHTGSKSHSWDSWVLDDHAQPLHCVNKSHDFFFYVWGTIFNFGLKSWQP